MTARACRIFDKTGQRMLYPKELSKMAVFLDAVGEPVQYKGEDRFVKLQNCVVMYATGMRTDDGALIWEADILEVDVSTELGPLVKERGFMQWDGENAKWSVHIPHPSSFVPNASSFPVEGGSVIGNIYQHPQLLKATQ